MKRRETIKNLVAGSVGAGLLWSGCKPNNESAPAANKPPIARDGFSIDRTPAEMERDKKLLEANFFTPEEMATLTVLVDIIIPADEKSGSASQAGVPDFIDFMALDQPYMQVPLRGGLRWLDMESLKRFGAGFTQANAGERIQIIEDIAWPDNVKPGFEQGTAFFTRVRNLTATGFYTSAEGLKDIDYQGNKPNQWKGVPDDVLAQYGLAYTEKELNETVKFK